MNAEEIINGLRGLKLSDYPYSKAKELILNFRWVSFITYTLHPLKFITRARTGGGYTEKLDLSYKPKNLNNTCQRASTPKNTMFYGTIEEGEHLEDTKLIATTECSALLRGGFDTSGIEKITYGRWQVVNDIKLLAIVHKDIFSNADNKLLKELQGFYEDSAKKYPDTEKNNLVMKFFAEEFSKKGTANDYDYFLSAIFSEIATDRGYDGIMYPSVQAGGDLGFNVAITRKAVDENLRLDFVEECTLYKNKEKSMIVREKISSMELWSYMYKREVEDSTILAKLGIESFEELKQ